MLIITNKAEFENELLRLNLSLNIFSKLTNIELSVISKWNNTNNLVPNHIDDWLKNYEYNEKLKLLQKEFIEINKTKKWKFEDHQQAIFDFVIEKKKITEFKIKDYDIILNKGNKNFGFQHLILRHYGIGSDGEIKALDILKIGNVIKQDTTIPAKGSKKIAFIQNKNGIKYTVILLKKPKGKMLFNFFSGK
ncbi:MAG: hypothetical protein U5K55_00235 [Aliarcobacter sp.]|nr:hypothetical protein [Aliarcobacter sp.]